MSPSIVTRLQAEQVVGGDAVSQAVRAAGVHVDIAADHAGELARRIRRVEEPGAGDRLGDADIGHARLHHRAAVGVVDIEDAVHPHHPDHHRIGERQRAARQRGAGAARHHADAVLVAEAQHGGDLLGGLRQHDRERHLAIGGQAVGLVGLEADRIGDQGAGGQQRAQAGDDRVAVGEGFRLGLGQADHGFKMAVRRWGGKRGKSGTLPVIPAKAGIQARTHCGRSARLTPLSRE